MLLRLLLALAPMLLLQQVPPESEPPKEDDPPEEENKPRTFTQEDLNRIVAREAKKAADKARADRDAEIQTEAQRTKDEAAGEFEKVKSSLAGERDTAIGERDTYKTRVETLEKLATDRLTDLMKAIPKEIADLGPDEDTPIEKRLAWAEKAAKAAAVTTDNGGNRPNPRPATGAFDRDAALAAARSTGKYSI